MKDLESASARHSGVALAALASAGVFAVAVFVSGIAVDGFERVIPGICFSAWVALPLLLLGGIKLFRLFPRTHLVLLVIGLLFSAFAAASPLAHGSTSAIALATTPFFLLAVYAVAGFTLVCMRAYTK